MTERKRPKRVSKPKSWKGELKKRAADKAREKAEPAPEVDPKNIAQVPELYEPAPADSTGEPESNVLGRMLADAPDEDAPVEAGTGLLDDVVNELKGAEEPKGQPPAEDSSNQKYTAESGSASKQEASPEPAPEVDLNKTQVPELVEPAPEAGQDPEVDISKTQVPEPAARPAPKPAPAAESAPEAEAPAPADHAGQTPAEDSSNQKYAAESGSASKQEASPEPAPSGKTRPSIPGKKVDAKAPASSKRLRRALGKLNVFAYFRKGEHGEESKTQTEKAASEAPKSKAPSDIGEIADTAFDKKYAPILFFTAGRNAVVDSGNKDLWEKTLQELDTAYEAASGPENQEAESFRNYIFAVYASAKGAEFKDKEILVYVLSELANAEFEKGEFGRACAYAKRAGQVGKSKLMEKPDAESLHNWSMLEHNVEFYESQLRENIVTAEAE